MNESFGQSIPRVKDLTFNIDDGPIYGSRPVVQRGTAV